METKNISATVPKGGDVTRDGHVLAGVIKFLSLFRAKIAKRSRRYRSRYWFARGNDRISRL